MHCRSKSNEAAKNSPSFRSVAALAERRTSGTLFGLALVALAVSTVACGPRVHSVEVVPSVEGATVSFDGEEKGTGITVVTVPSYDRRARDLVVCGPDGWFCARTTLDATTPERLELAIPRDDAWHDTVAMSVPSGESRQLRVVEQETLDSEWKNAADAIRGASPEGMAVDDGRSFYIQTAWRWAGTPQNETRLRSRITLSLDDPAAGEDGVAIIAVVETERVDQQNRTVGLSDRTFDDWLELLAKLETPS